MRTRQPPPTIRLAQVEALLAEDRENGVDWARLDIGLTLSLLRYALAHGAITVGDLEEPTVSA
jgi:hypothetical protein